MTHFRAPGWLVAIVFAGCFGLGSNDAARAQGPPETPIPTLPADTAVPPDPASTGQPPWLGDAPIMQAGPGDAVYLDQPVLIPANPNVTPQMFGPFPAGGMPGNYFVPSGAPRTVAPFPNQMLNPAAAGKPSSGGFWPLRQAGGPTTPIFVHRTSLSGEVLFIRPRDAEVAYAWPIDSPPMPVLGNEVPAGPVAVVDPEYEIGFRAGFNFALDQTSSLAVRYTLLRSDTAHSATAEAPIVLRSLVTHPLGADVAVDVPAASASLEINLDLLDADLRSLWYGSDAPFPIAVNYFVGAQYAMLEQNFAGRFVDMETTTVRSNVDFDGGGIRFGLQGERLWPNVNVFVYGTGVANILFGEFDARYVQTNTAVADPQAFTSWNAGRIVPVLDLELGAGWLGFNRHLRLSAGYRVSAWLNVVKTEDWIWAVQNGDFRNLDGTLTFDGLVGRAEWLF